MDSIDRDIHELKNRLGLSMSHLDECTKRWIMKDGVPFVEAGHEGQARISGEPFVCHPLRAAIDAAQHRCDEIVITATLGHDLLEDTNVELEEIQNTLGKDVADIVVGMTKIGMASDQENLEVQLQSMRNDCRLVMVKSFDRLDNMRTMEVMPLKTQERKARDTLIFLVPLARELGLEGTARELEDLSFRYIQIDHNSSIATQMQRYYKTVQALLQVLKMSKQ